MPRSAGGSYTVPGGTAAVSGQAIASADYNSLLSDLETEVTDSLSRSGKGAILANLDMDAFDILFNAGGVINWASSDVTITHSTNTLTWAGASSGYIFDAKLQGMPGLFVAEAAAAAADVTAHFQIWAKNNTPNELWGTDDAGTDFWIVAADAKYATLNQALDTTAQPTFVAVTETVYTISDGASVDIDPANGSIQFWTLGANRTAAASSMGNGESVTLRVADGTAYTLDLVTTMGVVWRDGTAPTLATTGYTEIHLEKAGNVIRGVHVGDFAS